MQTDICSLFQRQDTFLQFLTGIIQAAFHCSHGTFLGLRHLLCAQPRKIIQHDTFPLIIRQFINHLKYQTTFFFLIQNRFRKDCLVCIFNIFKIILFFFLPKRRLYKPISRPQQIFASICHNLRKPRRKCFRILQTVQRAESNNIAFLQNIHGIISVLQ